MNGLPEASKAFDGTGEPHQPILQSTPFFQRADWFSFAITIAFALTVYLLTLAPEVTLEDSGIFSAGAMYAGVAHPAGFPVWTLYAWLFTKLLPFSNVAWRVAVSSAVAAALTCGVIALIVSRGGSLLILAMTVPRRLAPKDQNLLCAVSGCVAALGFAFDGAFWRNAVVPDPWALSLLLFALALCFLMQWICMPTRNGYLYAASLAYGLLLTNNQSLAVAAFGFQFLILFANPALGRDLLFGTTLLLIIVLIANACGLFPLLSQISHSAALWRVYLVLCVVSVVASSGLGLRTRQIFTEWKAALATSFFFALGLSFYFYLPIASMTNPPMNWGYAREFDGFIHLISRGQFEQIQPTDSLLHLAGQMKLYLREILADFSLIYLIPAFIPFVILRQVSGPARRWMFGLSAVYLCLSFFLVAMLNPAADLQAQQLLKQYFAASHLILAIWAGYGLVLVGTWLAGSRNPG